MKTSATSGTLWIDVEDIFIYASSMGLRPTGIQRLAFELCRALQENPAAVGRIRFLRHVPGGAGFFAVEWDALARLFAELATSPHEVDEPQSKVPRPVPVIPSGASAADLPESRPRGGKRALRDLMRPALAMLPITMRRNLVQWLRMQYRAGVAFADVMRAFPAWLLRQRNRQAVVSGPNAADDEEPTTNNVPADGQSFESAVAPGDVLFLIGAGFLHADHAKRISTACYEHGMTVAPLIYDVIPLQRPEWIDPGAVRNFATWLDGILPLADKILTISRAAASDLQHYAGRQGLPLPAVVRPIPVGTGFTTPPLPSAGPDRPVPVGDYVLLVSTIEARKNHVLAFRVWRRLLDSMPAGQVPRLVFAGRIGLLVNDLMQQLSNTDFLNGHIVLFLEPTDSELEALYRGCLFTLFPSLYEGWGLPVTESLGFGKPCVISNSSSLPEAGGDLARYFDPENANDAYRVIRKTIEDRAGLAAWERRIAAEFRPVLWEETAALVLETLLDAEEATAASAVER